MHFFRTGHDIQGQQVLTGISWDLAWVALALGAAVILGHSLWRLLRQGRDQRKS